MRDCAHELPPPRLQPFQVPFPRIGSLVQRCVVDSRTEVCAQQVQNHAVVQRTAMPRTEYQQPNRL